MKRSYCSPEVEFVTFPSTDVVATSTCICDSVCKVDGTCVNGDEYKCPPDNDCHFCFYLVCTPVDVIIG